MRFFANFLTYVRFVVQVYFFGPKWPTLHVLPTGGRQVVAMVTLCKVGVPLLPTHLFSFLLLIWTIWGPRGHSTRGSRPLHTEEVNIVIYNPPYYFNGLFSQDVNCKHTLIRWRMKRKQVTTSSIFHIAS